MSEASSKNYRSILKGTALFGGVQVFNIIINLIRGKLIAVLLGPEGMGISSLLTASANTIQQFTGLGLNLSCVKEVSVAHGERDERRVAFTIKTVRRLLYLTALGGCLFTILCSSYLSIWTFGNQDYKWHFILLSVMIFFATLSNGELSILQGLRVIKKLAFASVVGSCIGLFIGVPLYYFYGYDGIVPAMIALSLATFVFYRYHSKHAFKFNYSLKISWQEMSPLARRMISLGVVAMVASLLGTLTNYLVNTYIGKNGSLDDVGLFQAANSITNQYIGLVFAAMGMDFFPRLSAVSNDNAKVRDLVNQQTEFVVLITVPLAMLLIITAPLLIRILLTDKFLPVTSVIRWMGVGIVLKAILYPMGYISFSKGDKKTFFWLEGVWGNLLTLCLNVLFYHLWGLYGLGISFVISFLLSCFIYMILTNKLYYFKYDASVLALIGKLIFLLVLIFCVSNFCIDIYSYIIGGGICCLSCWFCLRELDRRTGIVKNIKTKIGYGG